VREDGEGLRDGRVVVGQQDKGGRGDGYVKKHDAARQQHLQHWER
jgi:hypothetical protein